MPFLGDMLVLWRVLITVVSKDPVFEVYFRVLCLDFCCSTTLLREWKLSSRPCTWLSERGSETSSLLVPAPEKKQWVQLLKNGWIFLAGNHFQFQAQ